MGGQTFNDTKRLSYDEYKYQIDNIDNLGMKVNIEFMYPFRLGNKQTHGDIDIILYDADKLDSIGAIGVARDFLFAGNAGSNCLYTGNEKRLAKEKKDYSYTKEDSAILEYEIK